MLRRLVLCGMRDAALRLARIQLGPPPRNTPFVTPDLHTAVARWSTADTLQPVKPHELLAVFLLLGDTDAQWDATLRLVFAAAADGRAPGLMVHALGMGEHAAVEARLERAVRRAQDACAASRDAAKKLAAALPAAIAALVDGATLEATLAQFTAMSGTAPSADEECRMRACAAALRMVDALNALESSEMTSSAAIAARDAALALLPAGDAAASAAVATELGLLNAACARAAAKEAERDAAAQAAEAEAAVRAAADEAAAAEAAAKPLTSRLEALPRWEAALGAAASAASAAAIALARSLAHVRDAATLSARLAAAAAPPPSAAALPAALAALSAARDAAAAAPAAVRGALAADLLAAALRCTQWAALVELAAATASADMPRVTAAMKAATAAGADPDDIVRAMMPTIAAAASSEAAAPSASSKPTAPGEWLPAGPRLWFDVSTELGQGSRGMVVHPGVYLSERGRSAEACAVKRLRRDSGEAGKKQLEFVQREIENLTKLNACSARVAFFYDHHTEQDFIYMAFELFQESLLQRLQRSPPLSPPQRIATLAAVAAALRDCHAAGVAHNDVHAGNVLLKDGGDTVKLTDVQLSVRVTGALKYSFTTFQDKNVQINMACRAPEMQNPDGKVTMAVDVWALGALAFFLLTGIESPFAGKRAKQGAGGGRGASAPAGVALENLRIARGEHELAPLEACGLPKHAAAEARHLLSACLSKDAFRRPAAAAVPAHPLFWDAAAAAEALVTLRRRKPSEAALRSALSRASVPDAAYVRLADWRAAAHAPLLACAPARSRVKAYGGGLAELLRFSRNALEHPPPPGALPAAHEPPPGAAGDEARRAAVVSYLRDAWPELALAAHAGLLATTDDAAAAISTRTIGGADDDDD
jgi:serine/threonine protein kinase